MLSEIGRSGKTIVSSHPHRFEKSVAIVIAKRSLFYILRAIAKFLGRNLILKRVMSRFYYLANKI